MAATTSDEKDEVDLCCGNISPVVSDFDDPLKWWKVYFPLILRKFVESWPITGKPCDQGV